MQILDDITVLDFSQLVAGPSASMLLGDLGANVIKVESSGGDRVRTAGMGRRNGESYTFLAYNRNKRSLAIDLKHPDGRAVIETLYRDSDVVIDGFRPGVMDRLGLGYIVAKKLNPRIIYAALSGFGPEGPDSGRPGVDIVVQAESGIMAVTGERDGAPTMVGFTVVDAATGLALSQAILAALIGRAKTGRGTRIDVTLLGVALFIQNAGITEYLATGRLPFRCGSDAPLGAPAGLFEASDEPMIISAYFQDQWATLCRLLDIEVLLDDPRFADNCSRIMNRAELNELLIPIFRSKTRQEWAELVAPTNIMFGAVRSYDDVLASEQVVLNRNISWIDKDSEYAFRSVRAPAKFSEYSTIPRCAPPTIGADTRAILRDAGFHDAHIDQLLARKVVFASPKVPSGGS